jgi:hypothetical protein
VGAWEYSSMEEHLPGMSKALGSIASAKKSIIFLKSKI